MKMSWFSIFWLVFEKSAHMTVFSIEWGIFRYVMKNDWKVLEKVDIFTSTDSDKSFTKIRPHCNHSLKSDRFFQTVLGWSVLVAESFETILDRMRSQVSGKKRVFWKNVDFYCFWRSSVFWDFFSQFTGQTGKFTRRWTHHDLLYPTV